jgi:putative membrane protein
MPGRFRPTHLGFGALMGTADAIPGISGGAVALILGIYERLVESIGNAASAVVTLPRDRADAAARWKAVDWPFILPLVTGILLAFATAAVVIPPLLERYEPQMLGLFLGLVAGSVPVPWHQIAERSGRHLVIAGGSAVVAFLLVGLPQAAVEDPTSARVLLSGAFGICAMILPGVSGAFLLKVVGVYEATLTAARSLDGVYMGVFTLGAVVGLGSFARLLSWLLRTRHDTTMAVLVGLMVGALRALWPWQSDSRELLAPPAEPEAAVAAALAVVALAGVLLLTRAGRRQITDQGGDSG